MTRSPTPVLDVVLTRRSAPRLTEPAPGPADLERLVQAAATAPDHGRLRPWRLVAVRGDERARLGDALGEATDTPEQARRAAAQPQRAPLLLTIVHRGLCPTTRRSPSGSNWLLPQAWSPPSRCSCTATASRRSGAPDPQFTRLKSASTSASPTKSNCSVGCTSAPVARPAPPLNGRHSTPPPRSPGRAAEPFIQHAASQTIRHPPRPLNRTPLRNTAKGGPCPTSSRSRHTGAPCA